MTDEERQLAELQQELNRKQAASPPDIKTLNEPLSKRINELKISPERQAAIDARIKASERAQQRSDIESRMGGTRKSLGKYADANLTDYEVYAGDDQRHVLDRVSRMCDEIDKVIRQRLKVVLWGTLGTGKDHLAACLLLAAARAGVNAKMLSGRVFYDESAAAFSADSTQLEVYRRWTVPQILCLSDPVFETGWSPKWGEYLNRLLRMRYDAGKPTWATVNARSEEHAREMFGFDVWDRLIENAVIIPTRWPSYRQRHKQEEF